MSNYIKSFKSFQNAEEKAAKEVEAGANPQMIKEEDVTLTDPTLKDLSAKIQSYKNQINTWEKDIEARKKVLADEQAKAKAAQATQSATQPAPAAPVAPTA
jgi:predicted double-glycine peptidase